MINQNLCFNKQFFQDKTTQKGVVLLEKGSSLFDSNENKNNLSYSTNGII